MAGGAPMRSRRCYCRPDAADGKWHVKYDFIISCKFGAAECSACGQRLNKTETKMESALMRATARLPPATSQTPTLNHFHYGTHVDSYGFDHMQSPFSTSSGEALHSICGSNSRTRCIVKSHKKWKQSVDVHIICRTNRSLFPARRPHPLYHVPLASLALRLSGEQWENRKNDWWRKCFNKFVRENHILRLDPHIKTSRKTLLMMKIFISFPCSPRKQLPLAASAAEPHTLSRSKVWQRMFAKRSLVGWYILT